MVKKLYTVEADVTTTYRYVYTTIAESEEEALENIEDGVYETAEVVQIDTEEDSAPFNCEVVFEEEIDD